MARLSNELELFFRFACEKINRQRMNEKEDYYIGVNDGLETALKILREIVQMLEK